MLLIQCRTLWHHHFPYLFYNQTCDVSTVIQQEQWHSTWHLGVGTGTCWWGWIVYLHCAFQLCLSVLQQRMWGFRDWSKHRKKYCVWGYRYWIQQHQKYRLWGSREGLVIRYAILCAHVLTLITRKLQVVCWHYRYRMTAVLLEMAIFCGRGGCKILLARNASKCASQSPSD